jgi:hypothetical protein
MVAVRMCSWWLRGSVLGGCEGLCLNGCFLIVGVPREDVLMMAVRSCACAVAVRCCACAVAVRCCAQRLCRTAPGRRL